MPKTLTDPELDELRELIDAIDYRLITTSGQTLAEATQGEVLDDLNGFTLEVRRIRELLGLSMRTIGDQSNFRAFQGPDPVPPAETLLPLREQLVKKGIEPDSYRNVRRVQEKREAARKKAS